MRSVLLLAALVLCAASVAWLALAMKTHWHQVRGDVLPTARGLVLLRVLGAAGLLLSLALCLYIDHATMAALVWVMALAGAALCVAFTLSWRPRVLAPLVAWLRSGTTADSHGDRAPS
ncbi:MAG TPA: DUF3325 domain-containing protein [Burkholderiaceae bacterium]|nr:DUF3325 domain-containing protein [Burkholderiaceae bacterium]